MTTKQKIKRSEFQDIIKNLTNERIYENLQDGGFDAFLSDFLNGKGYNYYSQNDKEEEISLLEKFENLCKKLGFEKNDCYSNEDFEKILHIDRELYNDIERVVIANHKESFNSSDLEALKDQIEEKYEIDEDWIDEEMFIDADLLRKKEYDSIGYRI